MANQMIALGVRAPQAIDLGGAATRYSNMMTQRAQMEAYKQDAASKQLERDQKRALSAAYASAINPQTGEVDQAALIKNLQASGLGDAIPGALDDIAKSGRSRAEAKTADITYIKNFNDNAIKELTGALSPDQAIAAAARLKARFPDLGAKVDELIQTLPQDPAQYKAWRDEQLFHSMDADKQLKYTMTEAKDENMPGPNGRVITVRTGSRRPVEGVIEQETLVPRVPGGTGGPYEVAPTAAMPRGGAAPRANEAIATLAATNNDAEYQTALAMLERQNPQAAAQVRAIMPRFNPQQMQGLRSAAMATSAPPPRMAGNPPMVAGPRGGPDEGMRASSTQDGMVSNFGQPEYVRTGRPAYTRVPPPPQGPQPRETADEVYAKEQARLRAQRENSLLPQPLKPLTAPQEAKLRDNITKDYRSAKSTIDMMDGVVRAVNDVRNLSPDQKEAITGFSGYVPSVLSSSRAADTKMKNLQGKVTQMGKTAASLSGAIGQMAVQEWRIVSDMIASLDVTGMEPKDLNDQLDIIEGQARRAASITRDAYENQYVEEFARYPGRFQLDKTSAAPAAASRGPARVKNDADYARLKPGTVFIGPDGKQRRKP